MKFYPYLFVILIALIFGGCIEAYHPYSKLTPGKWRAVIQLNDDVMSTASNIERIEDKIELPFNFEVVYDSEEVFHINIINGKEKIRVDDIKFERDKRTAKDTVRISFPIYDSYIQGTFSENVIEGHWVVNYKENYKVPFVAKHGLVHRFEPNHESGDPIDMDGKWKVSFDANTDDPYPAIADFVQKGSQLSGTFLTETGDYRYLEGEVQGERFYLSCFDGAHAFLFQGKKQGDKLIGTFLSGTHYKSIWEGTRDAEYKLGDPNSLTFLRDNQKTIDFSFEDLDGNIVSLKDKKYEGKPKLIQIMGTWCPNCLDETNYLLDFFKNNPNTGIEVITIGFERYRDTAKSIAALKRWKTKKEIPFTVLHGGYYNKKEAAEKLPMLNKVISYPTLIFVDKNNVVQKIHTGFSGPATPNWSTYKAEMDSAIQNLIK